MNVAYGKTRYGTAAYCRKCLVNVAYGTGYPYIYCVYFWGFAVSTRGRPSASVLVQPRYCVWVVRLLIVSRRRLRYAARGASTGALQAAPPSLSALRARAMLSAQKSTTLM